MEPNTQNTNTPTHDIEQGAPATPVMQATTTNSVPLPKTGSQYFNNSIFWIEVEKIVPNPYQPRREFDPHALKDLSESIRMYGLLQPLVVTRREIIKEDGGLAVQYELISGERRLRASKLGGLIQVPVIIRAGEEDARVKLELAIIENLQREDLNAVDRARSFQRLADEFGLKHVQIAEKMGKSREYVTNSIRLLSLPEHMLIALSEKKISEGHTRPLLMLVDRPEEQETLFKEIVFKKITVREAESIARRVAVERTRKKDLNTPDPEIREFETKLNQALGTRVMIEKREQGGKVVIDFFSNQDLRHLLDMLEQRESAGSISTFGVPSNPSPIKPLFNSMPDYVPNGMPVLAVDPAASANSIAHAESVEVAASVEPIASVENSTVQNNTITAVETSGEIDFSQMNSLASTLNHMAEVSAHAVGDEYITKFESNNTTNNNVANSAANFVSPTLEAEVPGIETQEINSLATGTPVDDSTPSDAKEDEDLYSIKNFSI